MSKNPVHHEPVVVGRPRVAQAVIEEKRHQVSVDSRRNWIQRPVVAVPVAIGIVYLLILALSTTTSPSPNAIRIAPDSFPLEWPFAFPRGVVRCEHSHALVIEAEGRKYALNGVAQNWSDQYGYRDLTPMRLPNPEIPGTFLPYGSLVLDSYRALCD